MRDHPRDDRKRRTEDFSRHRPDDSKRARLSLNNRPDHHRHHDDRRDDHPRDRRQSHNHHVSLLLTQPRIHVQDRHDRTVNDSFFGDDSFVEEADAGGAPVDDDMKYDGPPPGESSCGYCSHPDTQASTTLCGDVIIPSASRSSSPRSTSSPTTASVLGCALTIVILSAPNTTTCTPKRVRLPELQSFISYSNLRRRHICRQNPRRNRSENNEIAGQQQEHPGLRQ